jgi:hypothetical protein
VHATPPALREERYDLGNRPSNVTISTGKKPVQQAREPSRAGVTWQQLSTMAPDELKQRNLFPRELPPAAARQARRREASRRHQIDAVRKAENHDPEVRQGSCQP